MQGWCAPIEKISTVRSRIIDVAMETWPEPDTNRKTFPPWLAKPAAADQLTDFSAGNGDAKSMTPGSSARTMTIALPVEVEARPITQPAAGPPRCRVRRRNGPGDTLANLVPSSCGTAYHSTAIAPALLRGCFFWPGGDNFIKASFRRAGEVHQLPSKQRAARVHRLQPGGKSLLGPGRRQRPGVSSKRTAQCHCRLREAREFPC